MTTDPHFGITPDLIALVKREEGWVPHPYRCPAGYLTIGYGHRISTALAPHPNLTLEEGEQLLMQDLRIYRDAALRLSPGLAHEVPSRLAALTDFCFNLGSGAYEKSTLRKTVDAGMWGLAGVEIRRWVYATDPITGLKFKLFGLVRRRDVTARWLVEG